jgi:hypothetical protein
MANVNIAPRLDAVREAIREPLTFLEQHLRAGLADNLKSITVVGSALTDDFRVDTSDINTVVLLDRHNTAVLNGIAALAKSLPKQHLALPLLMTADYIDRSRDVFGIEFLDFQLTHETILGDDPFAAIHIDKPDVRLQCERELKADLVRLRQGYIAAVGNPRLIGDLLIATAKGLAPLARAMLWLKDIERPRTMAASLRKAGQHFQVDLNAVVAAQQWRFKQAKLTAAQAESTFAAVLAAVDSLTTTIDELEL